jgi:hypothetical protein
MKSISLDTLVRETRTDSAGRFRFVNVPTGRSWWFALPESRDLRSDSLTVTDSGEQQVRLRQIDRGSESVLELALPGIMVGSGTITVANGDAIEWTCVNNVFTWTSGTGRFASVSGSCVLDETVVSEVAEGPYLTITIEWTASGTIAY